MRTDRMTGKITDHNFTSWAFSEPKTQQNKYYVIDRNTRHRVNRVNPWSSERIGPGLGSGQAQ